MAREVQYRHVNDTKVALAATLTRPDGTAVDLTGLTVKFKMVARNNTVKVAETAANVTVTDAAAGAVEYAFQSADVDTAGRYHAYFITIDGSGNRDTFPVHEDHLEVKIYGD
jgi:hypothetical protein